jgi:hypothetical protein
LIPPPNGVAMRVAQRDSFEPDNYRSVWIFQNFYEPMSDRRWRVRTALALDGHAFHINHGVDLNALKS